MSRPKNESPLAYWINRFLTHKRALGYRYRLETFVLQALCRHVEQCGCRDLNALCFERWMTSFQHRHPNTRHKWYQIVRHFCLYRRRSQPGCFLPSSDGVPKSQPYITPVIVEPGQIARTLDLASKLPRTVRSPLRAPALRLALVLLYTCGLRVGNCSV